MKSGGNRESHFLTDLFEDAKMERIHADICSTSGLSGGGNQEIRGRLATKKYDFRSNPPEVHPEIIILKKKHLPGFIVKCIKGEAGLLLRLDNSLRQRCPSWDKKQILKERRAALDKCVVHQCVK